MKKPLETEEAPDPGLVTFKEKMKEKEAIETEREARRNRPVERPIPVDRPQVTIAWGQGVKKLAKAPQPAKKAVPIVSKMPWLKRGGSAEYGSGDTGGGAGGRVSKFGPPITAGVNMAVPPPTLVTQVPTLGTSSPAIAVPPPPGMAPPPAPPPKPRIDRNPRPQSGDYVFTHLR